MSTGFKIECKWTCWPQAGWDKSLGGCMCVYVCVVLLCIVLQDVTCKIRIYSSFSFSFFFFFYHIRWNRPLVIVLYFRCYSHSFSVVSSAFFFEVYLGFLGWINVMFSQCLPVSRSTTFHMETSQQLKSGLECFVQTFIRSKFQSAQNFALWPTTCKTNNIPSSLSCTWWLVLISKC